MKPKKAIAYMRRSAASLRRALSMEALKNARAYASHSAMEAYLATIKAFPDPVPSQVTKEKTMTPEHIHEIAKLAAESTMHMQGMIFPGVVTTPPTPAEAGANVVASYLAAVEKLSAPAATEPPAA